MTLKELAIGESAVIVSVGGEGALRQHFLDMGVIPGAEVTLVKYAPMGDPMELRIHGYELTLRLADAQQIEVQAAAGREEEKGRGGQERARREEAPRRAAAPWIGGRGEVPCKGGRAPAAGRERAVLCPCGQPELRQDDAV